MYNVQKITYQRFLEKTDHIQWVPAPHLWSLWIFAFRRVTGSRSSKFSGILLVNELFVVTNQMSGKVTW